MLVLYITSIVVALLTGSVTSQESGWQPGQINATMCSWENPRAAVIRDTLYIDGGYLWWLPGFVDGTNGGGPTQDGNPLGIVYTLNFSQPFNISSNFSSLFGKEFKGANDQQAGTSGPQYLDGFMFANNDDWLGYGGLLALTNSNSDPPSSTDILGYEVYSSEPSSKRLQVGFYNELLPTGITRYITYGGGVNIPDSNLGYYFGGLRAADFGPIFFAPGNETLNADVLSNTLITVNMAVQESEKWDNLTVPSTIPGRASSDLVWIPVAQSGALIAIGGVILPEYDNAAQIDTAAQKVESNATSSKFMETVAVYDIAGATWYQQDTSGTIPPATAEGCTVVASASDGSSHNIYWYGGFNGIDVGSPFFDDVYVLSVPSFTWTKLYNGTASHGRAGHRCSKPYPDQMFVLGGYVSEPELGPAPCLEGGILQVFNLSSGEFIDSYNPTVWSEYAIPSAVTNVIGGSATGGAKLTSPSSWANSDLATLFGSAYSGTPTTKWYPYNLNATRPASSATPKPTAIIVTHSSGLPSWLAPVLGVVLGLMAVTAIVVIFLLWRRRRYLQSHQSEEGTSDLNRHRIMSWVRGMPTDATTKAATVTTDETPETNFNDADILDKNAVIVEAASNTVHEMMDTSRPQELSGTGLVYTNLSASASDASRMSGLSGMSGMTYASRRLPRASGTPRPESPSLGNIPPKRTKSGVSSMGSRHHHQVSEVGSVDSASTGKTSALRTPELTQHQTFFSPVSPPTPQNGEASDYINAGGASRPLIEKDPRRSNFEDLN